MEEHNKLIDKISKYGIYILGALVLVIAGYIIGLSKNNAEIKVEPEAVVEEEVIEETDEIDDEVDEPEEAITEDAINEEINAKLQSVMEKYADTLENIEEFTENSKYGLIYIDNDDIPELYFDYDSGHNEGATIYNCTDEVNELGVTGSCGRFIYTPRHNFVLSIWSGFCTDCFTYKKIDDDKKLFTDLKYYEVPLVNTNEKIYKYMIGEDYATEKEYLSDYEDFKKNYVSNKNVGMTSVTINDGFKYTKFDRNDFINNPMNYIVETPVDPLSAIDYAHVSFSRLGDPEWIELENQFLEKTGVKPEEVLMFTDVIDDEEGAFVFTGTMDDSADFEAKYQGKLWFIKKDSEPEVILDSKNGYLKIDGLIDYRYYYITEYYTSGAKSYVYEIKNGRVREIDSISQAGEIVDYKLDDSFIKVFDSSYDAVMDSDGSMAGHTWKPYYFGINTADDSIFEYVGLPISKEVLNATVGFNLTAEIEAAGYVISEIYSRACGIVNVNVCKINSDGSINFDNVNYDVNNHCYVDVDGTGENVNFIGSNFGGKYKSSILNK